MPEQFAAEVLEGFGVAGGVVILASWAVIGVLWRKISSLEDRNETLHEKRLDETKSNLRTLTDSLGTIRVMGTGGSR